MRKRLKRLKHLLQDLDIDFSNPSTEVHEAVQAGVFLAQLLHRKEKHGEADVTDQTGYFFKWYDGPYSSDLAEDYRELTDQLRFENATNGYPPSENLRPVEFAQRVSEAVNPPPQYGRPGWLQMMAAVAYLRAGADWSRDGAREEIQNSLGTDEHFNLAEEQLRDAGFDLNIPVPA